jgi:hypothetical protein
MSERPDDFPGEKEQTNDIAPDLQNSEQDDEQAQAQTLSGERLEEGADDYGLQDSEKVSTGEEGDDVQDLVDHMRQMVSSGRIDNSAYLGEPNHDDNDDAFLPSIQPSDPGAVGSDGE